MDDEEVEGGVGGGIYSRGRREVDVALNPCLLEDAMAACSSVRLHEASGWRSTTARIFQQRIDPSPQFYNHVTPYILGNRWQLCQ